MPPTGTAAQKTKRINFFKALGKKFKGLKGLYDDGDMNASAIRNPINTFQSLKWSAKQGNWGPKAKKHATLFAVGKSVRSRLINGPELNIVLCGVPFLLDFAFGYATKSAMYCKTPAAPAAAPDADFDAAIKMKFKKKAPAAGVDSFDVSNMPPLPPAPFSDEALVLYRVLLNSGMSKEGATKIVTGELEEQEVLDHLSESDIEAFKNVLAEFFEEANAV